MAEMYPGLLGSDPVESVDFPNYRDAWLRNNPGLGGGLLLSSPFASAYTPSGLLKSGAPARDYDYDWSRLEPGAPVVPYADTPTQRLLGAASNYDPGSGPNPEYEAPPFDPLGVEGYLIKESPGFKIASKLMGLVGLGDIGTFMALTGMDAERRAINLNRAQYESLDPLSLYEGFNRDFQLDIEDAGLPGVEPTWSKDASPDAMTAEEHAATQYGYFPSEDEDLFTSGLADDRYSIGHPDYEVPDWLEVVERSEEEGGDYTRVKDSMYDEADLASFYGREATDADLEAAKAYRDSLEPGHPDKKLGAQVVDIDPYPGRNPFGYLEEDPYSFRTNVGGDPSAIGDLGLQTDVRDKPNYYTGEWEVGQPIGKAIDMLFNTPWTGYDPTQRAYDIYKANYARDARQAYVSGGLHPFEAPAEWTDPVTGLTRSNYTQADRDAYREMEDARRTSEAATDQSVTGEWNPLTEPEMIDQYDQWGKYTGQISSAELTWNENINDPHKNEPGYHINLDWTDPDFATKEAQNEAIAAAMQARADARGVTKHELLSLEAKEQAAADKQAAQAKAAAEQAAEEAAEVAAAQAAIEAGESESFDWSGFDDWATADDDFF